MTSQPEPGWYPDALDPSLERWWDGAAWSRSTRPAVPVAPGQPVAGEQAQPQPELRALPPQQPLAEGRSPYVPGPGTSPQTVWVATAGPSTPDGVLLSGPAPRLLARIIDSLIIGALTALLGYPVLRQLYRAVHPQLRTAMSGGAVDWFAVLNDPLVMPILLRYQFVGLLVGGVYSVTLVHLLGGTLGKLAVGVRVRGWDTPGRPGWGQALARWLTRDAAQFVPGVGNLYWMIDSVWLLWDPRRQCLHDKLPMTVVVRHR